MAQIDDKIKEVSDRISEIKKLIPMITADAAIQAKAYWIAMNKGDSAGADINRNANIASTGKLTGLVQELELLTKKGGTLDNLLLQKQVQINAQQSVVDSALTNQQLADIEKQKIIADASKQENSNTVKIVLIVSAVFIVLVFIYVKFIR